MATCSSVLVWNIPQTEEPGGLQSLGSQELAMTEHETGMTEQQLLLRFFETLFAYYNFLFYLKSIYHSVPFFQTLELHLD